MSYWLDKIKELFNDNRAIAAFFAVVGLAVYSTNLNGPFLYDDISLVRNNDYIKSWSHLPQYFSQNEYAGMNEPSNYWRPLVLLVFSLEWHLWGEWPFGFHFVNIALHVASAFLLFLILLALFKKRGLAFLTALVFLIHPLQTEAVTYISGLGDPLSAFFMFLSILYFVGYQVADRIPGPVHVGLRHDEHHLFSGDPALAHDGGITLFFEFYAVGFGELFYD